MDFNSLLGGLRKYWRVFLLVHLLFTLLGITLLTPLFGGILQGLVSLSGAAAVADQDIARLLLTPLGLVSAVFLVALFLAIAGLEIGALQTVAQAARHSLQVTALEAAGYVLRRAVSVLRLTLGLTLRVLVYLVPYVLAVGAVAWFLLSEHDINYYLAQRPPEFLYALLVAGLCTLVLIWLLGRRLLGWSLIMPLVLFAGTRPEAAFRESEALTAGNLSSCLRGLASWLLVAVVLGLLPALFLNLSTGAIVGLGIQSLDRLVLLLGFTAALWSVLGFFVVAVNLGLLTMTIAGLYAESGGRTEVSAFDRALHQGAQRRTPRVLGLLLGLLAAAGLLGGAALLGNVSLEDRTLIVAHRGAAGTAPENTLAAVEQALVDGADWVEIDVQETRDGQVVVVHDSDFMKLAGNPLKVWDGDLAEIREIDVGGWFDSRFAGERVPTLQEVLAAVRGRARLVIELKYYGHDQQLEQRVVDIVESMDMADQVAIMSLKLAGIQKLQAIRPDWPAGLLAATAVGDLSRLDVDFLAVNQNMANPAFIERVHKSGKELFVWTVNDGLSLSRWMSMGVDGVITDEPALARNILAQRSELSSGERLLLSLAALFGKPEIAKQYRDNSP
jgi:glycerophosphoryl diester phosphodiesterase